MRAGDANACATTVIDHFTTSFNWAEINVGSVWLRPFHYLFSNSAITDQLYGGLGFVSGGSPEQALPGQLAITMDSLFVGSTAAAGAKDASPLGPDVSGAKCTGSFCSFAQDGVPYFVGSFQPKRLITIYDGPFFADGNVFWVDEKKGNPPASSVYLRTTQPLENGQMRVVDAGIGWKQPNGFYYPPVFGFRNSGFKLGSTRHNVVDQYSQYVYGNGETTFNPNMKKSILGDASFTPIDTQTVLNDLDGTLDGVKATSGPTRSSGLSNNHFYDTPFTVAQCNSFGTVTMPHEFASTFIAKLNQLPPANGQAATDVGWMGTKPAVAVYRQFRLSNSEPAEICAGAAGPVCGAQGPSCRRGTFFMGASIGQGIGLTVRDGRYYVDTASRGQNGTCVGATNAGFQIAEFKGSETYAIYNLFANSETKTTYQIYVGPNFDVANGFSWIRVFPHETAAPSYVVKKSNGPAPTAMDLRDGVLTITIDQSRIAKSFAYAPSDPIRCQPRDLCQPGPGGCQPVAPLPSGYEGLKPLVDRVCRDWVNPANAEVQAGPNKGLFLAECPAGGCLGFAFTLPAGFAPKPYAEVGQKLSECYPKDATWNRPMVAADKQNCPLPPAGGSFCR
jgi:hypothetical protein